MEGIEAQNLANSGDVGDQPGHQSLGSSVPTFGELVVVIVGNKDLASILDFEKKGLLAFVDAINASNFLFIM
jgi:hypothetical protein